MRRAPLPTPGQLAGRRQTIERTDDTRRVPSWSESRSKARLRPPASAVTGSDQARLNSCLEVAYRWFNSGLHRLPGQVVAAKHKVDGQTWEVLPGTQAGVDNTCMRTRGKHGYASSTHASGDKTFIEDQRIGLADLATKRVVTGKPGLVIGDAIDGTAAEEKPAADRMGIISRCDFAAAFCDCIEARLYREHDHQPGRKQNPALVWSIRMQVDDRSR